MLNNLHEKDVSLLKSMEHERFMLRHHYVGTEHLMLALLKLPEINKMFHNTNLNYQVFLKELIKVEGYGPNVIRENIYSPLLNSVLKKCLKTNSSLDASLLLKILLKENVGIAFTVLNNLHIDLSKINVISIDGLEIINNKAKINHVYCREKEIKQIFSIMLQKNKSNPLLVGEPGVGKTAIVEEIAYRIEKKLCPKELFGYQLGVLDLSKVLSGTKYRGEFEEKLNKIITFLINNPNYIIFIDEMHVIMNAGGAEGAIGSADILKPYLARGDFICIGATTYHEYEKIRSDKALTRRFQLVNINEPSDEECLEILLKIKKDFEHHYHLKINNQILNQIVYLSKKYITDSKNPDSAITILDSLCSHCKYDNTPITKQMLDYTINSLVNVKDHHNISHVTNIISTDSKRIDNYIGNLSDYIMVDLKQIDITDMVINNMDNIFIKLCHHPDLKIILKNYDEAPMIIQKQITNIIKKKYQVLNDGTKISFNYVNFYLVNAITKNKIGFVNNKSDYTDNIVNIDLDKLNNIALKS